MSFQVNMLNEASGLQIGTTVGNRYRVIEKIGQGGMAEVYLAENLGTGARVVLKSPLLGKLLDDPQLTGRFLDEIRKMSRLDHTNIVKMHDVLEWSGRPVAVMQYFGGGGLDTRSEITLGQWLPQIASALDYMHMQTRPMVHRDVKPANIFFDLQGTPYLGDFGIAKTPGGNTLCVRTETGMTLGTPKYMSPEAVEGKELNAQADQYSLAIVVYEQLAGCIPFDVDPDSLYRIMRAHAELPPRPLSQIDARYGAATSAVLDRALSKRPEDRFGSCGEFAAAVMRSLESVPQRGPHPIAADPIGLPLGDLPFSVPPEQRSASAPAARGWWSFLAAKLGLPAMIAVAAILLVLAVLLVVPWWWRNEPVAKHEVPPVSTEESTGGSGEEVGRRGTSSQEPDKPNSQPSGSGSTAVKGTNSSHAQKEDDLRRATAGGASNMNTPTRPDTAADKPVSTHPNDGGASRSEKSPARKREPSLAIAPFESSQAEEYQRQWAAYHGKQREITVMLDSSTNLKFVLIPPGEFQMGSPDSEEGHNSINEGPQHRVKITKAFYVGKHEVTQSQYEAVMRNNPSWFKGSDLPVEQVSWDDAVEFCEKLSALKKDTYRLPTEAQWEYACRAGTTTPFAFGSTLSSDRDANFDGNYTYGNGVKGPYLEKTASVGSYRANAWGLYDMHGNVGEFCADCYMDEYYASSSPIDPTGPESCCWHVYRGGSWYGFALTCRSADRSYDAPDRSRYDLGFRVALDLAE